MLLSKSSILRTLFFFRVLSSSFNDLVSWTLTDESLSGPASSFISFASMPSKSNKINISNFNILVSGQNAIYQNQSYTYQAFLNQLAGQNSINGAQIDGLSSSLISQCDFENSMCYYYVDISRGLPIEASVPKSVVLLGTNNHLLAMDYYVMLDYSARMSLSIISGSRVS